MSDINLYTTEKPIKLILKVAGNGCNIDCSYCFEKNKKNSHGIMSATFLKDLLSKIDSQVSIVFHGGEPLLIGIKKMDELLQVVSESYADKVIAVKVQTNGILISEEWIQLLFYKYVNLHIEIAISLDGTNEMNSLRVNKQGKSTYEKVIETYRLLDKHNIKAGMLSVISRNSLTVIKEYIKLLQSINNLSFVKLNPLFNLKDNKLAENSISPSEYANFVLEIAKVYIQNRLYEKIAIEPILSMIQKINGRVSRYCNYSTCKCFEFISVYPDGTLGPCDSFSAEEFLITVDDNSLENSILNALRQVNANKLKQLLSSCEECDIKDFCMSGCLSQRYYFESNSDLSEDYCISKKILYEFAKGYMI
ncbi:radical SAM protein [Pelosinus sp. sgz500959]|uniref:radical SAM protein n=1 Tax=Pelosinus sp. sgz500959 TaxID=3242472 RepID=UPI00366D3FA7